ncbi:MAG: hypothetical protein AAGA75_01650 [Cyanobacteria bacterium P01_E01_bin.6]
MPSKSLKATVTLAAVQVEDALVFLSDRYIKATKTTCRTVQTPTDYCWVDLCQPLIEGWMEQKVSYAKGKITLIFRSGQLSDEADMIIYAPMRGDRFLYTKPRTSQSATDQLSLALDSMPESQVTGDMDDSAKLSAHSFQHLLARQSAIEEKLAQFLASQPTQSTEFSSSAEDNETEYSSADESDSTSAETFDSFAKNLRKQLIQQIRDTLAAALQPLQQDLSDLREQMLELAERTDELEEFNLDDEIPIPQSRQEWQERIDQTWGTVGDYERYNASYRDANAESPLYETPDWVALCELDWARELCPSLGTLYALIHSSEGIGYEGADILQQFGQHIDSKTGDSYYIYRYSGFSAFEAFQQIINSPDHSWLPELVTLWRRLGSSEHEIFQMFGWEDEAIAALKSIATQRQVNQRSGYSWDYRQTQQSSSQYGVLKEYRAILNLGPFTPITLEGVKRAYRQAMKAAHPDSGGSTEYAQRVNEAYEAVMRHYFPEAT